MKRHVIWGSIGLVVILGVGAGAYVMSQTQKTPVPTTDAVTNGVLNANPAGATVVTLTKEGFKPDQIALSVGDTITFKTTTGNLYWPASNLHPSHMLYPEFDPQVPVSPGDTWSFTFTKAGEWKFHDHLSPYFTGTITVSE